jgi:hypothetical protein
MLLHRTTRPVPAVIERLVGLQAQTPHSWYVGLWARVEAFRPEHVADLLSARRLVRIALMRSTIHLVTARDCLALRPLVQTVIERSINGSFGRHLVGLDLEALASAGRALVDEQPRTFSELGQLLTKRWPRRDAAALAQAIRASVPLVQVPPRGLWGMSGQARYTSAEAWLGRPLGSEARAEEMILRYLGAFGPASVADMQAWSGLTRLREVTERLAVRLRTFRDEEGRELFDLPRAPRPDPDTEAAPRFLCDYDNLLLSHADRTRVIAGAYHEQGFTTDGPMPSTLLVDGFTHGTWWITRERSAAILVIRPFRRLSRKDSETVTAEGDKLLAFVAGDKGPRDVRFVAPQ